MGFAKPKKVDSTWIDKNQVFVVLIKSNHTITTNEICQPFQSQSIRHGANRWFVQSELDRCVSVFAPFGAETACCSRILHRIHINQSPCRAFCPGALLHSPSISFGSSLCCRTSTRTSCFSTAAQFERYSIVLGIMRTRFTVDSDTTVAERRNVNTFVEKEMKMSWFRKALSLINHSVLCCQFMLRLLRDTSPIIPTVDYQINFSNILCQQIERCLPFSTKASQLYMSLKLFADEDPLQASFVLNQGHIEQWLRMVVQIETEIIYKRTETYIQFQRSLAYYELFKPVISHLISHPFPQYSNNDSD